MLYLQFPLFLLQTKNKTHQDHLQLSVYNGFHCGKAQSTNILADLFVDI